ncbi:MAG: T9SS type A sorting domain-containing protein [Candidatus Marinimicrobia bacterium]|nr:T9SS type A sorting domain-containing protein [Candidatus Neomarinimicrobiota bacterium]
MLITKKGEMVMIKLANKFLAVFSLVLFSFAYAANVTIQVDMSTQTVSANGVHIAGSMQGWDPGTTELTDSDGDGVYEVTLDIASGDYEFKFINGNTWGGESDDEWAGETYEGGSPCRVEGGNRSLTVGADDFTYGPVCWESCLGCGEVYVTFRVDAQYEEVGSGVYLAGSLNGWTPTNSPMSDTDGDNIWEITVPLMSGETYQYKYVLNGDGWETVAEECATDGNRTVTVDAMDMVLDPVCYGGCQSCTGPPTVANVTFQADMSELLSFGWDGSTHFLELRGGMNGWAAGDNFAEDLLDPALYTITKEVSAYVGDTLEWKYKAGPDESWNNNGWETTANRTFEFTGEDIVLDPALPGILPTGELQNAVNVQFHIQWFPGTLNANNGEPFPQAPDTMIVNGSFLNCWCTWGNCMGAECAEPVSDEVPRLTDEDGDGFYTGVLELAAGHPNVITFKHGAYYPGVEDIPGDNGSMDNEAGFGADKVIYIPSETSGDFVYEGVFGSNNPDNDFPENTLVTFLVDMSTQDVSPNGVHIAGAMQGWDPAATELTDADGDGVYEVALDLEAGDYEFKFINGNTWGGESDDEWAGDDPQDLPCQVEGGNNRLITVGDEHFEYGPVCWESCGACGEVNVTFRLDAQYEEVGSGVYLAGSMQGWTPTNSPMSDADGDGVWEISMPLMSGETYQYKFVLNGDGWETVPDDCATDGNRTITVDAMNMVLDAVCYGGCQSCSGPPTVANITFQADMTELLDFGWDGSTHFLELRGGMNGWAAGDNFEEDLLDPALYSLTKEVSAYVGDTLEWKYKAGPDESWNNNGWETTANRTFEFTGEDIVLDPALPGILPTGELQNDVTVEFSITWHDGTLNANNSEPFPQAPDTIIVNGSFLNCWCTWGNCMGSGCAEPVSDDVPRLTDEDGDGIYTGVLELAAGHPNVITFKHGAYYPGVEDVPGDNGSMDNEAGFGADKVIYIPSETSGAFLYEGVFGSNNPENPWLGIIGNGVIPQEFAVRGNYPNPFNPITSIRFDIDIQSDVMVSIYNLMGEEVITLHNGEMTPGQYSVTWNAKDQSGIQVPSGMYLYRITSNNRAKAGKMLLLK